MNTYITLHSDDHDRISIRHMVTERRPEGYAVLEFGSPFEGEPSLLIFPTAGRLERLRAVITAYLEAHPPADPGPEVDVDEVFDGAWAGLR